MLYLGFLYMKLYAPQTANKKETNAKPSKFWFFKSRKAS